MELLHKALNQNKTILVCSNLVSNFIFDLYVSILYIKL